METQQNIPLLERYNQEKIIGADADEYSYMRVPVANFGIQMLQQMGWHEGRAVGKNPENKPMKPIQFVPRYQRVGLGAIPKDIAISQGQNMVAPVGPDGKIRNYINLDEKLVPQKQLKIEQGSKVIIIEGVHQDLHGIVKDINELKGECILELSINSQNLKIPLQNLKLIQTNTQQQQLNINTIQEQQQNEQNEQNEQEELNSDGISKKNIKKSKEKKPKKLKWVVPQIKVRIISRKYKSGKFYNTKVVVTDILDKYQFAVITPQMEILDDLREKDIETVLPKKNDVVMVLNGEFQGLLGKLLDRDKNKNLAVVQLIDMPDILTINQDDCAEYVK